MKKNLYTSLFLGGLAVAIGVVLIALKPAPAAPIAETNATGLVTASGSPAAGVTVSAQCASLTKHDTTDTDGSYLIGFMAAECPVGSMVKVVASNGSQAGQTASVVHALSTRLNMAKADVAMPGTE